MTSTQQAAALESRVMAQFDDLDAMIARIADGMRADGLIRNDERSRIGDEAQS